MGEGHGQMDLDTHRLDGPEGMRLEVGDLAGLSNEKHDKVSGKEGRKGVGVTGAWFSALAAHWNLLVTLTQRVWDTARAWQVYSLPGDSKVPLCIPEVEGITSGGQDMSWGGDLDLRPSGDAGLGWLLLSASCPARFLGAGSAGGTLAGMEMRLTSKNCWGLLIGTQQGQHQDLVAGMACVALPVPGWAGPGLQGHGAGS